MSVDYKKSNNGKCPVMHGGVTKAGESNTARLCLLYTSDAADE